MTRADRIIFILAILFILWLYHHYWTIERTPAAYAIIRAPNQLPLLVKLNSSQQLSITAALGETIIEIQAGKIRFLASPCRGKQCIHTGWLTHGGDFTACLPNRISIEVRGADHSKFDSIAY